LSQKEIVMIREGPPEPVPPPKDERTTHEPPPYPADKARGAEINLRTPARRVIFFGGLAGAVLLALLLRLFA